MRFKDYFQQQFLNAVTDTDPYKNAKEKFIAVHKKNVILNSVTDFKQPKEIGIMDIKITDAKIVLKDRQSSLQ